VATPLDWALFYAFVGLVIFVLVGVLTVSFVSAAEGLRAFLRRWLGIDDGRSE
jgi:hypothetical protein